MPSEGALQAEGFWVLTMLSNHALEHKEAVKAAGGLELITNALKAHPDHAAVQGEGRHSHYAEYTMFTCLDPQVSRFP